MTTMVNKEATTEHLELMRDLADVAKAFQKEHPEVSTIEVCAVFGAVAGAIISSNPDPLGREAACKSVVITMEQAIGDFILMRGLGIAETKQ